MILSQVSNADQRAKYAAIAKNASAAAAVIGTRLILQGTAEWLKRQEGDCQDVEQYVACRYEEWSRFGISRPNGPSKNLRETVQAILFHNGYVW